MDKCTCELYGYCVPCRTVPIKTRKIHCICEHPERIPTNEFGMCHWCAAGTCFCDLNMRKEA